MLLQDKEVAIIGAGPVGLTMAKLLQQQGVAVTVYERDINAQARIWGGPLDLHKGTGQDALKRAGLLQHYYDMAICMGRTITDKQVNLLFRRIPTPEEEYDNPEINRNDLRILLLESLAANTVVWDRKLSGLTALDAKWILHFEGKPDVVADFVIGANGGMSSVRKYVTDAEVEYTGSFIIQGEVPDPEINCPEFYQLCGGNILMTTANGITFTANPNNNGALMYGISFRKPESWFIENRPDFQDVGSIATLLSDMLADWHSVYKEPFRSTSLFVGLPTRKIALNHWKTNRTLPITLIGDAAHLIPPFAGEGVNTGLQDALILSDNLTNGKFDSVAAAISNYEQQMFVYAGEAQLQTSINEIAMHEPEFSFQKRFSE
ncbi:FAD-dependent oxidoreductase [Flavobacterium psychrotrophum]|uniref:FAD-dependent oxidoreductase n=1 Tax=Flavobacterium psychrotrophum TaxID=2294119 RepID=UPI000E3246DE|nr:NAD(P)/FAD-dependent oxidoreductase [Flavobacterium psychrotrophum]